MRYRNVLLILTAIISTVSIPTVRAADEGWQAIGVRGGLSMTQKATFFHQYEAFTVFGLPWHWRGQSGWGLSTKFNLSAGVLHGGQTNGFVGSFGPSLAFDKNGRGFQFEVGPDFVVVSRETYGAENLGGLGLFQGHGSVSYIFDSGFGIGYRAQHTSNAGVYGPGNLGYDLHMLSLSWNF